VYVIETGEGADELFFGYVGYLPALNESYRKLRKRRGLVRPMLARAALPLGADAQLDHRSYLVDGLDMRAHRLLFSDFLYQPYLSYQADRLVGSYLGERTPVNKFDMLNAAVTSQVERVEDYATATLSFLWNRSYRWADLLLDRIDSATMSAGVEGRSPFLDVDVIHFALSLADSLKVSKGTTKYVLRKVAERRVSREHAALPKRGFGGGNDNMLNDAVCAYMRERLASSPSYRHAPLTGIERLRSRSQLFTVTSFHAWVDSWM
jgi:asparagine synthase (glutamine-hydrolysing)